MPTPPSVPLDPNEQAEMLALAAKVAANTVTEPERDRWRALRARYREVSSTPTPTPAGAPARSSPRVQKKLRVGYTKVSDFKITFTSDVGEGGLRMRSPQLLPDGQLVVLQLHMGNGDDDAITVAARVAWSKRIGNAFECGLEFVGLRPEEQERLAAFMQANPGDKPA
jgi:hypothetical protein